MSEEPLSFPEEAAKETTAKSGQGYGSDNGQKFPYHKVAEKALFLVSCTTSLNASGLKKINKERRKNGEEEISEAQNSQRLLHELEVDGIGAFGCGVADLLQGQIEEERPLLECVPEGIRPLISEFELKLRQGLGKTEQGEDAWLEQFRYYSTKTKLGVLIVAGDANFFQLWAQSPACRREVEHVPEERLFAYLDGCIVRVNKPESSQLWVSQRTGQGSIVWSIGELYQGALKRGKQNGLARHYFVNGDVYEGNFVDGKMEGNAAKYVYSNGDLLQGNWKSGMPMMEKCKYVFSNGKQFEGTFPEEVLDAKGIQEIASGRKVGTSTIDMQVPIYTAEEADENAASGYAEILYAAEAGDLPAVRGFVRRDADAVKQKGVGFGETALHKAAYRGDFPEVVRYLLEQRADVHAVDNNDMPNGRRTPLHVAAINGRLQTARVLLEFKADVNLKDIHYGYTPLDDARRKGHTEVVKLLEAANMASMGGCS